MKRDFRFLHTKQPKKAAVKANDAANDAAGKKKVKGAHGVEDFVRLYKFYFPENEKLQALPVAAFTKEEVDEILGIRPNPIRMEPDSVVEELAEAAAEVAQPKGEEKQEEEGEKEAPEGTLVLDEEEAQANLELKPVAVEEQVSEQEQPPGNDDYDQGHSSLFVEEQMEQMEKMMAQLQQKSIKEQINERFTKALDHAEVKNYMETKVREEYRKGLTFPKLSPERGVHHHIQLFTLFNFPIYVGTFGSLLPDSWLNDEVIDFYLSIVWKKARKEHNVICLSVNFNNRLEREGLAGFKTWGAKKHYDAYDKLVIPINVGDVHWVLAVVDKMHKEIRFYDSKQNAGIDFCVRILDWYEQYLLLFCEGTAFDRNEWKFSDVDDFLVQKNNSDCGVYVCLFADLELNYVPHSYLPRLTPTAMNTVRLRIACELKHASE